MQGDRTATKPGTLLTCIGVDSCAPLIQLSQPRSRDVDHLPQASDLEPQCLLSTSRQAVFATTLAPRKPPFGFPDETAGKQAIQVRVQSAGAKFVCSARLPLHRLHDPISVQIRLGKRKKDM